MENLKKAILKKGVRLENLFKSSKALATASFEEPVEGADA